VYSHVPSAHKRDLKWKKGLTFDHPGINTCVLREQQLDAPGRVRLGGDVQRRPRHLVPCVNGRRRDAGAASLEEQPRALHSVVLAGEVEQPRGHLLVQHLGGLRALADAPQGLLPKTLQRREQERGVVLHHGAAEVLVLHPVHAAARSRAAGAVA
jgi:hypothetical protein